MWCKWTLRKRITPAFVPSSKKDDILCSHILKVMLHFEVDKIPHKYIIHKWLEEGKKMNLTQRNSTLLSSGTMS